MTEWTVVTVIVVLTGLVISLVKPMLSLNSALTRLTDAVSVLERELGGLTARNSDAHDRFWERERMQDMQLQDHEKRISIMEEREV